MYIVRGFEKVSYEQFAKDILKFVEDYNYEVDDFIKDTYDSIKLPQRATMDSAGYDIFSPVAFTLYPNATIKIPTGIKAYMNGREKLSIHVRSSTGFKYNVNLLNATGIIDRDYFGNENNEGHIWMGFKNHGSVYWNVKKGEAIGQCIFETFLIADDDQPQSESRVGGIGSTSK
jgi:dUTP pyrophosphatase